jgi:hypothetical protein
MNSEIFAPNKATQFAPSQKGTRLYIPGLIKFCLTDGQENKIWLDKITGLKRDYRVSILIDSSYSCFNEIMICHSIQTIISLIGIFSQIEIQFFDLIIATSTSPIILSTNQNSHRVLDPNFPNLYDSLFSVLSSNETQCNLFDAIQVVIKLNLSIRVKTSYLFILNDLIFSIEYQKNLKNNLLYCKE